MVYLYDMCKTTVLNVNTTGIQLQVITDILTTYMLFTQQFNKQKG